MPRVTPLGQTWRVQAGLFPGMQPSNACFVWLKTEGYAQGEIGTAFFWVRIIFSLLLIQNF